jgi:hypothetical protein
MHSCRDGVTGQGTSSCRKLLLLMVAIFSSVTALLFFASTAVKNQTLAASIHGVDGAYSRERGECICCALLVLPTALSEVLARLVLAFLLLITSLSVSCVQCSFLFLLWAPHVQSSSSALSGE